MDGASVFTSEYGDYICPKEMKNSLIVLAHLKKKVNEYTPTEYSEVERKITT